MVWDVRCCYSLDVCAHPVTKGSSVGTLWWWDVVLTIKMETRGGLRSWGYTPLQPLWLLLYDFPPLPTFLA